MCDYTNDMIKFHIEYLERENREKTEKLIEQAEEIAKRNIIIDNFVDQVSSMADEIGQLKIENDELKTEQRYP